MGFILRVLVVALGLWLASALVPGIQVEDGWTLIGAALLLGIVNALVRPLIVILTLPITILTLGLFLLVINAAMLGLVASFFDGSSSLSRCARAGQRMRAVIPVFDLT
jgi:putative membrane protein